MALEIERGDSRIVLECALAQGDTKTPPFLKYGAQHGVDDRCAGVGLGIVLHAGLAAEDQLQFVRPGEQSMQFRGFLPGARRRIHGSRYLADRSPTEVQGGANGGGQVGNGAGDRLQAGIHGLDEPLGTLFNFRVQRGAARQ